MSDPVDKFILDMKYDKDGTTRTRHLLNLLEKKSFEELGKELDAAPDREYQTRICMHYAAAYNEASEMDFLLARGIDLRDNKAGFDKIIDTAYHWKRWPMAEFLVERGADARAEENFPKKEILKNLPRDVFERLSTQAREKADAQEGLQPFYMHMLDAACGTERKDILSFILEKAKLNRSAQLYMFDTVLKNKLQWLGMLKNAGIWFEENAQGKPFLAQEIDRRNEAAVIALLENGADPHARTMTKGAGDFCFTIAFINLDEKVTDAFLKAGLDVWSEGGYLVYFAKNHAAKYPQLHAICPAKKEAAAARAQEEFDARFGTNPCAKDIRRSASADDENGLILAAKADIFPRVIEIFMAQGEKLSAADVLFQNAHKTDALDVLAVNDVHLLLANYKLWKNPAEDMAEITKGLLYVSLREEFAKAVASQLQRMETEGHIAAIHAGIPKNKFKVGRKPGV